METICIGDQASMSKEITPSDLELFASLSMDRNPVHLDDEYAKSTVFGQRIAHGLYVASFISAVLAQRLPGPGSIYLSQELNFRRPAFVGDTITATVVVAEILKPTVYRLHTTCCNQRGEVVIDGSAVIKKV